MRVWGIALIAPLIGAKDGRASVCDNPRDKLSAHKGEEDSEGLASEDVMKTHMT